MNSLAASSRGVVTWSLVGQFLVPLRSLDGAAVAFEPQVSFLWVTQRRPALPPSACRLSLIQRRGENARQILKLVLMKRPAKDATFQTGLDLEVGEGERRGHFRHSQP